MVSPSTASVVQAQYSARSYGTVWHCVVWNSEVHLSAAQYGRVESSRLVSMRLLLLSEEGFIIVQKRKRFQRGPQTVGFAVWVGSTGCADFGISAAHPLKE